MKPWTRLFGEGAVAVAGIPWVSACMLVRRKFLSMYGIAVGVDSYATCSSHRASRSRWRKSRERRSTLNVAACIGVQLCRTSRRASKATSRSCRRETRSSKAGQQPVHEPNRRSGQAPLPRDTGLREPWRGGAYLRPWTARCNVAVSFQSPDPERCVRSQDGAERPQRLGGSPARRRAQAGG